MDGLERKVDGLEGKVGGLDRKVGALESKLDAHGDVLASVAVQVSEILRRLPPPDGEQRKRASGLQQPAPPD